MSQDRLNLSDLKAQTAADLLAMAEELEIGERLDDAQGRNDVPDPSREGG